MKPLLDFINEDKNLPQYITVQAPVTDRPTPEGESQKFKKVRVETRPEITWMHRYIFSFHDELNWQRRIVGTDKLTHEEGNYIHFMVLDGSTWTIYAMYNTKEEMLYCDNIRDVERTAGVNFSVSMNSADPKINL